MKRGVLTISVILFMSTGALAQGASEATNRQDAEATNGTVKAIGRVADENGMPLAGATIRVAVPAADMRLG